MTNTHTTDAIPSIRLWADTIAKTYITVANHNYDILFYCMNLHTPGVISTLAFASYVCYLSHIALAAICKSPALLKFFLIDFAGAI